MMIFDTHTHLNDDRFYSNVEEYIKEAYEYGVTEMAVVGFDAQSNGRSVDLASRYDNIYSIIGYHPTEIKYYNEKAEKQLQDQLESASVIALGEIGLDYYWMEDDPKQQEKIFRRQLAIAREMHLPVSIHTRSKENNGTEAYEDVYRILKEEKVTGIIHSFNGNSEWMKKFVDLGMMVSFSGVVTFKNAKQVKEAALNVPKEAYLLETDAPYLAPVPMRGKENHPAYTKYVAECIADIRGESLAEVGRQTTYNAHRLFHLGDSYE